MPKQKNIKLKPQNLTNLKSQEKEESVKSPRPKSPHIQFLPRAMTDKLVESLQYLLSQGSTNTLRNYRFGKNLFVARVSMLDDATADSFISKGSYRGFHGMIVMIMILFVVNRLCSNYELTGSIVDFKMLRESVSHYGLLIFSYFVTHLWASTAYILQKLILCGLSIKIARVIQHVTQSGLFVTTIYFVAQKDLAPTAILFIVINCIVYFFKIHSYTMTNYTLRQKYLKKRAYGDPIEEHEYPHNINFKHFVWYLFIPACVYETQYPMKPRRNWFYFARKLGLGILIFTVMYINVMDFILPVIKDCRRSKEPDFFLLFLELLIPVNLLFFSAFLLVFDTILNMFGQLTRFADRQFYQDFWNACTVGEYFRKWNRVFYEFFFRHIYVELITQWNCKEDLAKLLTFIFSAGLQQFMMVCIFKFVKPVMFGFFVVAPIANVILNAIIREQMAGNIFLLLSIMLYYPGILTLYLKFDMEGSGDLLY